MTLWIYLVQPKAKVLPLDITKRSPIWCGQRFRHKIIYFQLL